MITYGDLRAITEGRKSELSLTDYEVAQLVDKIPDFHVRVIEEMERRGLREIEAVLHARVIEEVERRGLREMETLLPYSTEWSKIILAIRSGKCSLQMQRELEQLIDSLDV